MGRAAWKDWVSPSAPPPRELIPIFGAKAFTPQTSCADIHPHGPIPEGSICCCMHCHQSGMDGRPMKGEPVGARINEGWDQPAAQPTKYEPEPAGLAGGTGKVGRANRRRTP